MEPVFHGCNLGPLERKELSLIQRQVMSHLTKKAKQQRLSSARLNAFMGLFDGYFSNDISIYYPSTGDKCQLNFVCNVKGNPRVAGVGRIIQDNSASIMKSFPTLKATVRLTRPSRWLFRLSSVILNSIS